MNFGRSIYPFSGAGSKNYKDFNEIAERYGVNIVAEAFGVSDESLERASESGLLRSIADRVERGEDFNVQEELESACGY